MIFTFYFKRDINIGVKYFLLCCNEYYANYFCPITFQRGKGI